MLGNGWLGKHSYELRLLGFPYEGELVSQAHVYHFLLSSCMVHGAAPGDHKDCSATYKCESTVSHQWCHCHLNWEQSSLGEMTLVRRPQFFLKTLAVWMIARVHRCMPGLDKVKCGLGILIITSKVAHCAKNMFMSFVCNYHEAGLNLGTFTWPIKLVPFDTVSPGV